MADDEEGAGPVVEEVLQGPQGVEVEVVRGLVEQQHVGLLGQRQEELDPPSLTAREEADRRPLGVVLEPERLQQPSVGPVRLPVRARHRLAHPLIWIERVAPLVVHRDPRRGPVHHPPLARRAAAGDDVEEGRLARTVGSDDPEALTRVEGQVEVPEQPAVAVAVADVVELHHLVTEAGRLDVQREVAGAGGGLGARGHQRGGGVDPRLRLAGARGRAAPEPRQLGAGEVASLRLRDL